jgi:hypothetical protein
VGRDGGQGGVNDALHSNSGMARVPTSMDEAEGKVSLLAAVANRVLPGRTSTAPTRPEQLHHSRFCAYTRFRFSTSYRSPSGQRSIRRRQYNKLASRIGSAFNAGQSFKGGWQCLHACSLLAL